MLTKLVDMGVDPTREDSLKQTGLFYAVRDNNSKIVAYLLSKGCDSNKIDVNG